MTPDPVQAGRKLSVEELAEIRESLPSHFSPTWTNTGRMVQQLFDHIAALQAERDEANEKFLDLAEMAGILKRQRDELVEALRGLDGVLSDYDRGTPWRASTAQILLREILASYIKEGDGA